MKFSVISTATFRRISSKRRLPTAPRLLSPSSRQKMSPPGAGGQSAVRPHGEQQENRHTSTLVLHAVRALSLRAREVVRVPSSRLRLGGEVQASKLIHTVMPVYPASAKAAGVQGTVILHAVVGMDGRPLSLRVMNNDIHPELARAAIEAVSQWRYRPTLLNGEPIEIDTTIMVNFSLES